MRILVTGHEGYLGSVLVSRLLWPGTRCWAWTPGYFAGGMLGPVPEPRRRRCGSTCAT